MGPAEIVRRHKQVVITVTLVTNLMKIDPSECHSSEGFKVRRLQTLQSSRYHPTRVLDRCRRSSFNFSRSKQIRIVCDMILTGSRLLRFKEVTFLRYRPQILRPFLSNNSDKFYELMNISGWQILIPAPTHRHVCRWRRNL